MFKHLGAEETQDVKYEPGFVKILVYKERGDITHFARLERDGSWTSKLGYTILIKHQQDDLNGSVYGDGVEIMKIPKDRLKKLIEKSKTDE